MRKRTRARECALQVLYQMDITRENCDDVLNNYWSVNKEAKDIEEFCRMLTKGTAANMEKIDSLIAGYAENWEIKRMAVVDRNILRLSAFELLFLEDMPPKVSINEAIDLAKKFGDPESGRFVNGILDKINKSEEACRRKAEPPGIALREDKNERKEG